MGKYPNAFFSETTNMIKAKLYMNVHWKVLYKFYVFYADRKSKMATTVIHRLTLEICIIRCLYQTTNQQQDTSDCWHSDYQFYSVNITLNFQDVLSMFSPYVIDVSLSILL
jgi:hypothetical protein